MALIAPHPTLLAPVPTIALSGRMLVHCDGRRAVRVELETRATEVLGDAVAVVDVGDELWLVTAQGTLRRIREGGEAAPLALPIGAVRGAAGLRAAYGASVTVWGQKAVLVRRDGDALATVPLGFTGDGLVPLPAPARAILRSGRRIVARGAVGELALALPADLVASCALAGGAILDAERAALALRGARALHLATVSYRTGQLLGYTQHAAGAHLAWVEGRGHAVIARGRDVSVVDLAAGTTLATRELDATIEAIAVDAAGERLAMLVEGGEVMLASYLELAGDLEERAQVLEELAPAGPDAEALFQDEDTADHAEPDREPEAIASEPEAIASEPDAVASEPEAIASEPEAIASEPEALDSAQEPESRDIPYLAALRARRLAMAMPPDDLVRYLEDTRALLGTLCRRALAEGAAMPKRGAGALAELDALLEPHGVDEAVLADACTRERAARDRHAHWSVRGAPHVELAIEFGLSPLATTILLLAAGAAMWGELARAYALICNDHDRPQCDEHLVIRLLGADLRGGRAIAAELDEDAPLVRHGLLALGPGRRPFRDLVVPDVVVRRLAGDDVAAAQVTAGLRVRAAEVSAADVVAPRARVAALVRALAAPSAQPVRLVIRGREGSGRRTIAAALAACADRRLGEIDLTGGSALAPRLCDQLRAAALCGLLPCVSGLDAMGDDPSGRVAVRAVLDAHPGPLVVRAALGEEPPLAPGFLELDLPVPAADRRAEHWRRRLAAHDLPTSVAGELADRFAIGAGAITRAVAQAAASAPADQAGLTASITDAIRQARRDRIGRIATRVEALPGWGSVVLSEEIERGVHQLIARVRNRHTVLERWGMAETATTGRGITALLQGGPGTGKTLVAGLVARELGYELYRIDLSRVVSKWLGETEKNLGAVFDAAEDGEVVLLFDEADSLFARRTEVKSSHDRYANLEVNYLLQRLDSFEGIAILTTNFGTAIDPAFRRRLAMRLEFPMPEEHERSRLWRVHLPTSLPHGERLDLDELAGRYPMSGAYIRNAALRAAFLAAAEQRPITTALLHRAVELEYREAGQIDLSGVLQ